MKDIVKNSNSLKSKDPFADLFSSFFSPQFDTSGVLKTDIYEDNDRLTFKVETPGVSREDISITVDKNKILTIKSESKQVDLHESAVVHRQEIKYGSYSKSWQLPDNIELNNITSRLNEGILSIEVPKRPLTEIEKQEKFDIPIE